ncbi:hypothetical protein Nepgr_009870 [Nepenthes gracilis]|uniref:Uncharacterized protein n=1 Tax=Nepenthes gracilis TaxID=150966 RepID=A0AAD3SB85_NEPGR|nr:hypothetical protein Nepgr_009870 [Nepenthes gracilis]
MTVSSYMDIQSGGMNSKQTRNMKPKNDGSNGVREGRFDYRGKGIVGQRHRSSLRRHQRGDTGCGSFTSGSLIVHVGSDAQIIPGFPSSIDEVGNEFTTENSALFDSNGNCIEFYVWSLI